MIHMPMTTAGNNFHYAYTYAGCNRVPTAEFSAISEFLQGNNRDLGAVVRMQISAETFMRQSGMIN